MVNVVDNIAAARIGATRHGALGVTSASWFDPEAHAVASFSSVDDQTTIRFVPRGHIVVKHLTLIVVKHLTLSANGVGPIRFGASPGMLERRLDPILRRPDGGYQSYLNECGVDHTLTWPIVLNPLTGQLERSEELTAFFDRGRFVGYQYGGSADPQRGRLRVRATTAAGLAIGDTLAAGQRLYGRAFQISTAQGGSWQASTPQGILRGYAFGHLKSSDVSLASRVASIDAGNVGCPALSP